MCPRCSAGAASGWLGTWARWTISTTFRSTYHPKSLRRLRLIAGCTQTALPHYASRAPLVLLSRRLELASSRRLEDDGLDVWLAAVVKTGATTALCLRWASGLTDGGMVALAEESEWVSQLWRLDIAFSGVGDRGLELIAAMAPQLTSLAVSGCRSLTDRGITAVGSSVHGLQVMEMEMLSRVSDFGVQALVRGCPKLEVLLLGGCSQLSNITTQLIVDHLGKGLRRLDLGGLPTIIDMDLEDLRRCTALRSLSVRANAMLTDGGAAHLATLCKRQAKLRASTAGASASGGGGAAAGEDDDDVDDHETCSNGGGLGLESLDLGGLVRLTDRGLSNLLQHASALTSLDLSGCNGISPTGLIDVVGALPEARRRQLTRLTMTGMQRRQQGGPGGAAAPAPAAGTVGARAEINWQRLQELLGPQATIVNS